MTERSGADKGDLPANLARPLAIGYARVMILERDIEELFVSLPLLASVPRPLWHISPLGGMTNRSFRLQGNGLDLVLRWPGASASRYLDRRNEGANAAAVAALGLAPQVLASDPHIGWYITAFVDQARALTAHDLGKGDVFAEVVGLLARLHRADIRFPAEQNLFRAIDLYLDFAPTPLMTGLRRQLDPVVVALARRPGRRVPSHIDASPANFLQRRDSLLYLIDWEFAAMEESLWDLATVALETPLGEDAVRYVIEPVIGADQWPRFELYKTALLLVAASWCEMELAAGNPSDELTALRDERAGRLAARLADPRFAAWLAGA